MIIFNHKEYNLETGKLYSRSELRKIINPIQSAVADYVIMDLMSHGRLEPKQNRQYLVKI